VKVPFTWKVTGWFMIGWSAEFPQGEARPLRYFGEDLVAYRDEAGELHLLSGHCRHLGAHIGHGGKVVGDCVECPFHGWRWGPDGTNRYIPYQPDRPNRALRLRVYPVREQYGCVFMWHQPDGKEPQWELPDLFHKFPQFDTDPEAYYRPYPEFSRRAENEPVHPQIVAENGPDSSHFHYVHGATVTPVCLNWEAVDEEWRFLTGWPDARSDDPNKMARPHPCRRKLNGQRHAVEAAADLRHGGSVVVGDGEIGPCEAGAVGEQLDGLIGQRQRRHLPHRFARHSKWFTARCEHGEAGRGPE
jgi:3-ketosteroid 9alpha-monooxygenase subunit A